MTLAELRTKRLVYMANSFAGHRQTLYDVLLDADLVNNGIAVDSHEIARGFALQRTGIAALPDILAEIYVENKVLCKLDIAGLAKGIGHHEIVAVVRPEDLERRSVSFFVENYLRNRGV